MNRDEIVKHKTTLLENREEILSHFLEGLRSIPDVKKAFDEFAVTVKDHADKIKPETLSRNAFMVSMLLARLGTNCILVAMADEMLDEKQDERRH